MSEGALPTVGIVGLGHIGGSLALALQAAGADVVATSRSASTRERAAAAGVTVVDEVEALVDGVDVVVASGPLETLSQVLGAIATAAAAAGRTPTLTDVGSVKGPVQAWVTGGGLPDPSVFVAGHPMAGNEGSGWSSAVPDLFEGRTWAVAVAEGVSLERWADVARLALAVGSEVVPLDADEHDAVVALTSHLPYVLAAVVAGQVAEEQHPALARSLAAGSYDSLTRVAGGHRTLGAQMALGNRDQLARRVRAVSEALIDVATALEVDGEEAVTRLFDRGWASRAAESHGRGERRRATLVREELLDLGRSGGRVLSVEEAGPDAVTVELR